MDIGDEILSFEEEKDIEYFEDIVEAFISFTTMRIIHGRFIMIFINYFSKRDRKYTFIKTIMK